jgi:hypothetical protein
MYINLSELYTNKVSFSDKIVCNLKFEFKYN